MPPFKRPGPLPSRAGVYPDQAFALIEQFRRWIGADALSAKRRTYREKQQAKQGVAIALLREQHPLLDAFAAYDRITLGQRRTPKHFPDELGDLANVAAQFSVVGPTLAEDNAKHHRHSLLGPGFRATLLEWKTATALVSANDARLAWLPPSQPGPELVAQAGDCAFEVECKHVTHMITELFGDSEAGDLADLALAEARARGLCGELLIECSDHVGDVDQEVRLSALRQSLAGLQTGATSSADPSALFCIRSDLRVAAGIAVNMQKWVAEVMAKKAGDMRAYCHARADGPLGLDPLVVLMTGPRRTAEELLNHLWERKFQKAAEQCSANVGAFLVFEWEGIEDSSTFAESEGMQALMARTFDEYRHVAGIAMRCDNAPMRMGGVLNYASNAYLAKSNVTSFPEVAELLRLERDK
jgi:hypothetical protein